MLKTTKKTNKQVLYTDPLIYTIDNFLTDEDCAHFIKLGEGNIKRALVAGTTKGYESRGRSGGNYWIRSGWTTDYGKPGACSCEQRS